jgi:hypothetical protein
VFLTAKVSNSIAYRTSYLDIIQEELLDAGYFVTRIDGSMNTAERIRAMEDLSTEGVDSEETPRFILCSLHACGTGITLTRANWVFMMDTWCVYFVSCIRYLSISVLSCSHVVFFFILLLRWNVAAENQAVRSFSLVLVSKLLC